MDKSWTQTTFIETIDLTLNVHKVGKIASVRQIW